MKIGLLCGGFSDERAISLKTSKSIFKTLQEHKNEIICVDPAFFHSGILNEDIFTTEVEKLPEVNVADAYYETIRYLKEEKIDIVLNGLHGGVGEDGRVQALLDLFHIPYTGSGQEASAIGMDKDLSKTLFRFAGGRTADWILINDNHYNEAAIKDLGLPLVIKGNHQGSSVSLTIIDTWNDLKAAVSRAMLYDKAVIAEKFIQGKELTVTVLEGEALPIVEIVPKNNVYDYQAKYTKGGSDYFAPARIDAKLTAEIQEQALLAWKALKLANYARIDFRLDENNQSYFLEANTLPGMTELSLIPMSAKAAGMDFNTLLNKIMEGPLNRFQMEKKAK